MLLLLNFDFQQLFDNIHSVAISTQVPLGAYSARGRIAPVAPRACQADVLTFWRATSSLLGRWLEAVPLAAAGPQDSSSSR